MAVSTGRYTAWHGGTRVRTRTCITDKKRIIIPPFGEWLNRTLPLNTVVTSPLTSSVVYSIMGVTYLERPDPSYNLVPSSVPGVTLVS